MININIKDNQEKNLRDVVTDGGISDYLINQLCGISKTPINELLHKNYKEFFIFTNEDKIEDKKYFYTFKY